MTANEMFKLNNFNSNFEVWIEEHVNIFAVVGLVVVGGTVCLCLLGVFSCFLALVIECCLKIKEKKRKASKSEKKVYYKKKDKRVCTETDTKDAQHENFVNNLREFNASGKIERLLNPRDSHCVNTIG